MPSAKSILCEKEPIHIPGAIQPYGALLGVLADSWLVSHASANLASVIDIPAAAALGRPLQEIIGKAACQRLRNAEPHRGHASVASQATIERADGTSLDFRARPAGQRICIDIEAAASRAEQKLPLQMTQPALDSFRSAATCEELCALAVRGMKTITGYDRVMAYRFGDDGHGEVIAEECSAGVESFLGLHYPASDIPAQARRQYLRQPLGMIANAWYQPVPLQAAPGLDDGAPLDLTYSQLRSVSPMHREYMQNMKTAASLTVALSSGQRLWGMLVCHHLRPRLASLELRSAVKVIGQVVSLLVGSLQEAELASHRLRRNTMLSALAGKLAGSDSLAVSLAAAEPDLLHLLDATGGVIRLSGQILHLGKGLAPSAAEQLLGLLHADAAGEVLAVNSLAQRYPQLAVLAQNGSGALLQPLGYSAGDTILWFRREQSSIVTWGGSPDDEAAALGSRLGPRASFTAWQQVIRNQSAPWTQVDLAMASEVARAVGTEMVRRTKTELDRMRDASRSKSRFLANVSHELRTPLHGIIGYAELVVGEGGLSLTQVTRVEAVQAASQRLLQLIDRVLEFSEVDAEAIALHVVPVDAREAALASVDAVRPAAAAKGLRLHMAVVPSTPRHLLADGTQLQQVLANLLGNAVKFADAGAVELNLMPASRGARIRFEVVDSGPGIPAEQRAMLFQGFERFDVAGDKLNDGAGLGLAIAARLAGLMGGRLGHEPNPAGGSIFWLELPAEGAAASAPATQRKADGAASPQEGLRVLVVDDVLMNRDIAASFLRAAGHQVAFAEDGLQAVKAVEALDFDVVLMDIRMPVMDGLEATRRIRELPGYRGTVPIVAVTAQTFQDQVRQCRSAGMQGHLGKPFDPALLHASVTQAASGRRPRSLLAQPEAVTVHPAPGKAVQGADLPVLDVAMLERTAAFLPADAVNSYLSTIAGLATSLLAGLQQPDALIRKSTELAEAAHTLAGSAGMFGFVRVTSLGRSFQRAVQTADADTPSIAAGLGAAIEATLRAVHARAA